MNATARGRPHPFACCLSSQHPTDCGLLRSLASISNFFFSSFFRLVASASRSDSFLFASICQAAVVGHGNHCRLSRLARDRRARHQTPSSHILNRQSCAFFLSCASLREVRAQRARLQRPYSPARRRPSCAVFTLFVNAVFGLFLILDYRRLGQAVHPEPYHGVCA